MTKEELFKKNFPEYVTEKGACLSPYWDLFSAGIECATYELNKGCIQILTKENAELKNQVSFLEDNLRVARKDRENLQLDVARGLKEFVKDFPATSLRYLANEKYVEQFTEAKEIIKKFSEFVNNEAGNDPEYPEYSQEQTDLWNELCDQAEQFLEEVSE